MGFIGDILSSDKGAGFQASGAAIDKPVTTADSQLAAQQAKNGLSYQQQFLDALNARNGLSQQVAAGNQQQALADQLAANHGAQNEAAVFNQQQGLANQLQDVANGNGPNPAQTMLNTATGNNIASTAALMAGQRGASANAGLLARQAGQAGANANQQAAGQGATMQANQQLGALGQLGQQQQALQAAAANQVSQQASQQANLANLTSQMAANQQAANLGYAQSTQGNEANVFNQTNAQNNASVSNQSNINNANAGIAGINAKTQGGMLGGLTSGIGAAVGLAHGGQVPKMMADGGMATTPITSVSGPQSNVGQYLSGTQVNAGNIQSGPGPSMPGSDASDTKTAQGFSQMGEKLGGALKQGAGEAAMGLGLGAAYAKGGNVSYSAKRPLNGEMMAAQGKMVPGKAKAKGDNLKNDTVPALLSPGEVVIPRSVMNSPDPVKNAAKFVEAVMAKNGKKGPKRG